MTTKKIIITLTILTTLYFLTFLGKRLILNNYKQKGDIALFLSGDYVKAIKYYDKIIDWETNAPGVYFNRGDAYEKSHYNEKALIDYKNSLAYHIKDSFEVMLRIAQICKERNDFATEEIYLKQLVIGKREMWTSGFQSANLLMGQLEFKRKNYRKAIYYYNIADSICASLTAIYHRANAYYALGLIDSAKSDLKKSLRYVKADFVEKNPNSQFAKCDTCHFPFGSKEYELLTELHSDPMTFIQALEKFGIDKQTKDLKDQLKTVEKNGL